MTKGKQVRAFKASVPQPDLSHKSEIIKVYFQSRTGRFSIYGPDHVLGVVHSIKDSYGMGKASFSPTTIEAARIDDVVEAFGAAMGRYVIVLRQEIKKKVILFKFECNQVGDQRYNNISFAGSPCLHVDFEVLWEAGGRLYRQDEPDDLLTSHHKDGHVIDWTPEREAFFEKMRSGLIHLIARLIEFNDSLKTNPEAAIAALTNGAMLLPPPAH